MEIRSICLQRSSGAKRSQGGRLPGSPELGRNGGGGDVRRRVVLDQHSGSSFQLSVNDSIKIFGGKL